MCYICICGYGNPSLSIDLLTTDKFKYMKIKSFIFAVLCVLAGMVNAAAQGTTVGNIDKEYNPQAFSGMGRKYLGKNMVNGKNILTQDMLCKDDKGRRVPNKNTIFEVEYDYDLNGATITIPEGSLLKFDGGKLDNGKVIFNGTSIASSKACFGKGLKIEGKVLEEASPEWFTGSDADKIEQAIRVFKCVKLAAREYLIDRPIVIENSFLLKGVGFADCYGNNTVSTPYGEPVDYSQSQLVAMPGLSGTAMERSILEIRTGANRYLSIVIDGVGFTSSARDAASGLRMANGISIYTPGGPSRPVTIRNCNFKMLNYGLYIHGSDATHSTNVCTMAFKNNNCTRNNWGIYITGRHAIMNSVIEQNVIEQNICGAIYVDDDNFFPVMGSLLIKDNLLEGQPNPVTLKAELGCVAIEGNYFESSKSQTITLKGDSKATANTQKVTFVISHNTSHTGAEKMTYRINSAHVEIAAPHGNEKNNTYELSNCVVETPFKAKLGNSGPIVFASQNTFAGIPADNYRWPAAPNYIIDGKPNFVSVAGTKSAIMKTNTALPAGRYRCVCFVKNTSSSNKLTFLHGSAVLRDYAIPVTDGLALLNADITIDQNRTSANLVCRAVQNGGELVVSPLHLFKIDESDGNVYGYDVAGVDPQAALADIINPKKGDMFYHAATGKIVAYNGTAWVDSDGKPITTNR